MISMKRKTSKKPTPAQIRARKKFAAMAKERARLARIKKGLTAKKTTKARKTKKRNTTIIRAKRVKVVSANPKRSRSKAKRKNPSSILKKKRERFTGKKSTKTLSLSAPSGAPSQLAILGRLKAIKLKGKTVSAPRTKNPNGKGVYLAEDTKGNLHIIGDPLPLMKEKGRHLGEIREIEYIAQKPHLGYPETTEFFHQFGEEGGKRPHLSTDSEGALLIKGGDYFITERGIENPSRKRRTKRRRK